MKYFVFAFLICGYTISTFAQSKKPVAKPSNAPATAVKTSTGPKIGYIYQDYIYENYTEVKTLEVELENRKKAYQQEIYSRFLKYDSTYNEYQASLKNVLNLTNEILNDKLRAVQNMKADAENFQKQAEEELQAWTNVQLLMVQNKLTEATNKVAQEKGFPFVIKRNKSESILRGDKFMLYSNDKGKNDLSDAVLISLGSTPPPAKPIATIPMVAKPVAKRPTSAKKQ
jgi:outer membrane protein